MTRGDKRLGAGRPFSENPQKMSSFRLSEEEEKAVRKLLKEMRGKLVLFLTLFFLSSPAIAAIESKATIDFRDWQGYGVAQYGTRDDNEYATNKYKYRYGTLGSKKFYYREAALISRPCRDMQANGVVYEEPNCRIKEDGSFWNNIVGWSQEDYGAFIEYDTRWIIEILRKYVYALDEHGRVAKYKITETKHKNFFKQFLYGNYDVYELVSYFVQTQVGEKPKNYYSGFKYDKNGRMLSTPKQTNFSEIVEYDANGNVLTVYRKDEHDYIKEYAPDGKTLKTYHDTKYIPYLQWNEDEGKRIYKTIDEFQAGLFDR